MCVCGGGGVRGRRGGGDYLTTCSSSCGDTCAKSLVVCFSIYIRGFGYYFGEVAHLALEVARVPHALEQLPELKREGGGVSAHCS